MKIKVTAENLENAIDRAHRVKGFVRHIGNDSFEVTCQNPNCVLGNKHVVEFEIDADGDLAAECLACPSALGKHVCYHVPDALALRYAMIAAHIDVQQREAARDFDGLTETAIQFDGVLEHRCEPTAAPAPRRRTMSRMIRPDDAVEMLRDDVPLLVKSSDYHEVERVGPIAI